MRLLLVSLLGLAIASPAWAGVLAPGRHDRSMFWDGIERTWFIHVPSGYDGSGPVPLLLALHGAGSNADLHQVISGMSEVADENGFLVVYPQGVDDVWNTPLCCGSASGRQNDVEFLLEVVSSVQDEIDVDPKRIYVSGFSNGGAMTHRLACEATDVFAAAAPVAFGMPFSPITDCKPSRPIPILSFMGLHDTVVPYDGGGFLNGALASLQQWRANNGCGDEPIDVVETFGGSNCATDTTCSEGVFTGLCSVDSTSLPGSALEGHVIYINDDIDVQRAAWDFLSSFTLPEPSLAALQAVSIAVLAVLRRTRPRVGPSLSPTPKRKLGSGPG